MNINEKKDAVKYAKGGYPHTKLYGGIDSGYINDEGTLANHWKNLSDSQRTHFFQDHLGKGYESVRNFYQGEEIADNIEDLPSELQQVVYEHYVIDQPYAKGGVLSSDDKKKIEEHISYIHQEDIDVEHLPTNKEYVEGIIEEKIVDKSKRKAVEKYISDRDKSRKEYVDYWKEEDYAKGGNLPKVDGKEYIRVSYYGGSGPYPYTEWLEDRIGDNLYEGTPYSPGALQRVKKELKNIQNEVGSESSSDKYNDERQEYYSLLRKLINFRNQNYAKGGSTSTYFGGGNYLEIFSEGDKLIVKPTEDGLEELRDGNDVSNLFEDISSNSEIAWHDDLGMMGFGLTEASGLTDGFYYEDDGSFTNKGNEQGSGVYYFNDYMLRSPEDDLMNRGELVLFRQKRVGEYAKGGSIKDISFVKPNDITSEEIYSFGNKNKLILYSDGKRIGDFYFNMKGYLPNFYLSNDSNVGYHFSEKGEKTQLREFKKALRDGFTNIQSYAKGGKLYRYGGSGIGYQEINKGKKETKKKTTTNNTLVLGGVAGLLLGIFLKR